MADVRPFNAIRPAGERAEEIAALPYDVYSSKEARIEVKDKPLSFLRIDRAEVNFPEEVDIYDPRVYEKARDLFWEMFDKGYFVQDSGPYYYIYELTMNGRTQTGIVGLASIDDYDCGVIKRHENTRREKEEDRVRHVDTMNAQTGPIFLAYRNDDRIKSVTDRVMLKEDLYDFKSEDGVRHRVFIIHEAEDIKAIQEAFESMDSLYIADGHHRAASAVRVGKMRRGNAPRETEKKEHDYFLSVLFPDDELRILDYNRVLASYNGHERQDVIRLIEECAYVTPIPEAAYPDARGSFSMCIEGDWYMCSFHPDKMKTDIVGGLDVSLLQDLILEPVFGIQDPKTDNRIDFVGGIRGLLELEQRTKQDMKIAFAMYPTSIHSLMEVADAGLLMPPKSTWFEPKLRSGLFIHKLS